MKPFFRKRKSFLALCVCSIGFCSAAACAEDSGYAFAQTTNGGIPGTAAVTAEPVSPYGNYLGSSFRHNPGLIAEAEWLSWRTAGTNKAYAETVDPVWLTGQNEFNLSPQGNGLRARFGYRTVNMWDYSYVFTHYNGDEEGSVFSKDYPQSTLNAVQSCLNLGVDDVTMEADSKLNVHDIEIGRWTSENNFGFRPFGGVRLADLSEEISGNYHYTNITGLTQENKMKHTSDMTGYGIRGGVEADLHIGAGFSVFGKGAGSVLVGTVDSASAEADAVQGTVLNRTCSNTRAVPVLETSAGVVWNYSRLQIKGGYELSSWFNASELNQRNSDVLFHGFFAGGSWNF